MPSALKARGPNHWTTEEIPNLILKQTVALSVFLPTSLATSLLVPCDDDCGNHGSCLKTDESIHIHSRL